MRFLGLAMLCGAGCFPYLERYRPAVSGRVLDSAGVPSPLVTVTACSYTHWWRPKYECPRKVEAVTDRDGGFSFPELTEWEWCCIGEAPLPRTVVFACTAEGGAGFESPNAGWPGEVVLRLGEGSARCEGP